MCCRMHYVDGTNFRQHVLQDASTLSNLVVAFLRFGECGPALCRDRNEHIEKRTQIIISLIGYGHAKFTGNRNHMKTHLFHISAQRY